ncbi:unnamed protein product [marine sediment metagenome]|uniref:Uncharacterized protein n=2 Tax=marine sediment metagenome TaxID=412755 RepID=X1PTK7_9ZZZZ
MGDIRRLLFKDFWELHGFARVEQYEPGKGANFYVGKYLTKTAADIRFSHNLKQELERTPGEVAVSQVIRSSAGAAPKKAALATCRTNSGESGGFPDLAS